MTKLDGYKLQRESIRAKIDACWVISEYQQLKNQLIAIEEKIHEMSFENYAAYKILNERLNELENDRIKAELEKEKCNDLTRYRKLVDTIRLIQESIDLTKRMIKELA